MMILPSLKILAVSPFTVKWTCSRNPHVVSVKSTAGAGTITGGVACAVPPITGSIAKSPSMRPFERVIIGLSSLLGDPAFK
jgi:hypothetical protein